MKVRKVTETNIDLDAIRTRIRRHVRRTPKGRGFTPAQRDRLIKFYDLFEAGEWSKAVKFAQTWPDDPEMECTEREFIDCDVYDVLWHACMGLERYRIILPPNIEQRPR